MNTPETLSENPYYAKLKVVIEAALSAFEDGKVTMTEVWMFVLILSEAIKTVLEKISDLSDEDLVLLQAAGNQLYEEHVEPLDIPGPDWLIDPLLKNGILPAMIEGAFRLAKSRVNSDDSEGGDGAVAPMG